MMNSVQRLEQDRRYVRGESGERQRRRWDSFTDWARAHAAGILLPIARTMGRLGIHPNTITVLGMLLQFGVAIVFGLGYLRLGGLLLLIVAPVDALDGALARALDEQTRFGSFLDSTLDRFSDAALILGLTAHYMIQGAHLEVVLLLTALVSALMVSYTRARAESLGFSCKVGVLTRLERVVLIAVLSALGLPALMLWALALLSIFTVLQRVFHVYAVSRLEDTNG